jgi:hypothetical protein
MARTKKKSGWWILPSQPLFDPRQKGEAFDDLVRARARS